MTSKKKSCIFLFSRYIEFKFRKEGVFIVSILLAKAQSILFPAIHFAKKNHHVHHLRKEVERLRRLAFFDRRTGLPNLLYLEEHLPLKGFLLFADMNGMGVLNKTLGHSIVDDFLVQFSERLHFLSRILPVPFTTYRMYNCGDEFLLIFNENPTCFLHDFREYLTCVPVRTDKEQPIVAPTCVSGTLSDVFAFNVDTMLELEHMINIASRSCNANKPYK